MKLIKYMMVGGAAACVDLSIFFVFAKVAGYNYLAVAAGSFVIATLINYVLSIKFVFQSNARFGRHHEIILVYMVSLAGLSLNELTLYLTVDEIGLGLMVSKIAATGVAFFWNFSARQYFVFKPLTNNCVD